MKHVACRGAAVVRERRGKGREICRDLRPDALVRVPSLGPGKGSGLSMYRYTVLCTAEYIVSAVTCHGGRLLGPPFVQSSFGPFSHSLSLSAETPQTRSAIAETCAAFRSPSAPPRVKAAVTYLSAPSLLLQPAFAVLLYLHLGESHVDRSGNGSTAQKKERERKRGVHARGGG